MAQARSAGDPLVPAGRGAQRLRDGWAQAAGEPVPAGLGDGRLLRLAAALAADAVLSGSNELYHRDLPVNDALALALKGAGGTQAVTAHEIRDRVRARFPALPPLPDRPRLDQLLAEAGLGLVYDDAEHGYRWPTRAADTKGLASRQGTVHALAGPQLVTGGRSGHRLAESAATRSFLALGVDADRSRPRRRGAGRPVRGGGHRRDRRADRRHAGAWRPRSACRGTWSRPPTPPQRAAGTRPGSPPWSSAACPPSRTRSPRRCPARPTGTRPVVLTEIAPLARYGHLAMLASGPTWARGGRRPSG